MPGDRLRLRAILVLAAVLAGGLLRADDPPRPPDPEVRPKVGEVPAEVREKYKLDPFYKKYASAGGLPVLSSEKVSDEGVREAAYLIDRMLNDRARFYDACACGLFSAWSRMRK
jgi:hypothetical protein